MVVIFRGISGAGKGELVKLLTSTDFTLNEFPGEPKRSSPIAGPAVDYVRTLWNNVINSEHKIKVFSADDYFMDGGEYKFDPKLLGAAHGSCMRLFFESLRESLADKTLQNHLVVDNTNCSVAEVVPYAAMAAAYVQELHIVTLLSDPERAWRRNRHGTPLKNIMMQDAYLRKSILEMPPWFPQEVFPH